MTDFVTELGKIAGVLAFLGYIPYLLSIVRRKTLPNPATWWIWSIMGAILLASYYAAGNQDAIWVPISYFVGPTVTAILSVRYGRNEFSKFEWYCLAGAGFSLLLWWLTESPEIALTINIMIDLIAIAPTLRKTYFKPDSEDPLSWSIFWVANTLNVCVVLLSGNITYGALAYPLELFLLPTSIMFLVIRGKLLSKHAQPREKTQTSYQSDQAVRQSGGEFVAKSNSNYSELTEKVVTFKTPGSSEHFGEALNDMVRQAARQIITRAVTDEINGVLGQDIVSQSIGTPQKSSADAGANPLNNQRFHNPEAYASQHTSSQAKDQSTAPLPKASQLAPQPEKIEALVEPRQPHEQNALPEHLKKEDSIAALMPWLYLSGNTAEQASQILIERFGKAADAVTPSILCQIEAQWKEDYQVWDSRSFSRKRYVYLWADSVDLVIRGNHRQVLMIAGVSSDGYKELLSVAIAGLDEEKAWSQMLLQLRDKGLRQAPQLAIGKDCLALWNVLLQVFPTTQLQGCWDYKTAAVLKNLPSQLHSKAANHLWEIYRAETKSDGHQVYAQFVKDYQVKYPEAVDSLIKSKERLLSFYDFPAEHWQHIRSVNLLSSTFSTVRMKSTQDAEPVRDDELSDKAALTFVFKLVEGAQRKWPRLPGAVFLGDVIEGAAFRDGLRLEGQDTSTEMDGQKVA